MIKLSDKIMKRFIQKKSFEICWIELIELSEEKIICLIENLSGHLCKHFVMGSVM